MQHVVEFSHPGVQNDISFKNRNKTDDYYFYEGSQTSGVRLWSDNKSTHFRKFISTDGKYLTVNNEFKSGKFAFWGEWEGHSEFYHAQASKNTELPDAIHKPFYCEEKRTFQNTDPFCFVNPWMYGACKQPTYSFLRELAHGSIILFGTEYKKGFALDTVFVVDYSTTFGEEFTKNLENNKLNDFYEQCSNNAFYIVDDYVVQIFEDEVAKKFPGGVDRNKKLDEQEAKLVARKFYRAKNYKHGLENSTFSFAPGKPHLNENEVFPRVYLDYSKFKLQKPGAGTVCYRVFGKKGAQSDQAQEYFNALVAECFSQGYSLGVDFSQPPILHKLPTSPI